MEVKVQPRSSCHLLEKMRPYAWIDVEAIVAVDRAGELVLPHRVGEGELHLGRQMPLVAAAGGIGVAEAVVRRDRVSSRDVRAHAVESGVVA